MKKCRWVLIALKMWTHLWPICVGCCATKMCWLFAFNDSIYSKNILQFIFYLCSTNKIQCQQMNSILKWKKNRFTKRANWNWIGAHELEWRRSVKIRKFLNHNSANMLSNAKPNDNYKITGDCYTSTRVVYIRQVWSSHLVVSNESCFRV